MTNSGLEKFMQWFQKSNPQAAKQMQQNLTQNKPGMQNQMGVQSNPVAQGIPQTGGQMQPPMGQQMQGMGIDGGTSPEMMAMMSNPQMMQQMQQKMQQMQQMQPLHQAIAGMRGQDGGLNPEMLAARGNPQMQQQGQQKAQQAQQMRQRMQQMTQARQMQPPMGIQDGGDMAGLLRNRGGNVPNMMQFGMG